MIRAGLVSGIVSGHSCGAMSFDARHRDDSGSPKMRPMICDGRPTIATGRWRFQKLNSGPPSLYRISGMPKVANSWRRKAMRPVAPGHDVPEGVIICR